ncbi:MAG: chlorophyll synthesis pathway protein BchC [Xanthobacteraceae bacterium]
MDTMAVVLEQPRRLKLSRLSLCAPGDADVVVDIDYSGVSTGTERLLWSGRMPPFPGLGYPLVPGYESVGTVIAAAERSGRQVGETVFVPGASCYGEVRGLFGGAARRVVTAGARVVPIGDTLQEKGVLLALAATAQHAIAGGSLPPDLIIGHGVLGRLLARLVLAATDTVPVVWERDTARARGADGYPVLDPAEDQRRDYRVVCDASGDPQILDTMIARLAPGGEIVLAGFYSEPLSFAFAPAFMRETRIRIAAEWKASDLATVQRLIAQGRLSLDGLITHCRLADQAGDAYRTAFDDPSCLKMILDWRGCA